MNDLKELADEGLSPELSGEGDSFSLPQKRKLSDVFSFPPDSSSSTSDERRAVESEIERMKLEVAAVQYCLSHFGNIVTPETREKEFVLMYRDFNKEDLTKQFMNLQAEKLNLQAEKLELQKQKTISMSSNSRSGKLDSTSLYNEFLALFSRNISPPDGYFPPNISISQS